MDKLSRLLSSVPVPPLTQKKQTPSYLQDSRPPRWVNLGSTDALPLGLEKQKTADELFARSRRCRFGAVSVSDFVSKRVTDQGLHQTLIEAQWCD
jgi:hypothetical protein